VARGTLIAAMDTTAPSALILASSSIGEPSPAGRIVRDAPRAGSTEATP
jgi:hypothetical protein